MDVWGEGQQESDAGRIARAFHEEYEGRAYDHGYKTRKESAVPWEKVPENNRSLMIATVEGLLQRGVIQPGEAK